MRCFAYGHDRKYLAMKREHVNGPWWLLWVPMYMILLRWTCRRCAKLGQSKRGLWRGSIKIEHGELVLDEKAWANWE